MTGYRKNLFVGLILILSVSAVFLRIDTKSKDTQPEQSTEVLKDSAVGETLTNKTVSDTTVVKKLPVFPGAVGFGTHTKAGRGGRVIEVTTLEDGEGEGPEGSLRRALEADGPRIIVFKVGGTIKLKDALYIRNPYITIAGHTAPGDGITIRDFGIQILTHDILMQHVRIRPGNEGDVKGSANDGINFLGTRYGGDIYNVVIDHVSVSWAEDENISTIGGLRDITISNSIISEGLNQSRHGKGTHSTGLYIGDTDTFSIIGNVLAHNNFRNPAILNNYDLVSMTGEVVNNVIYNWQDMATEVTNYAENIGGYIRLNVLGNLYLAGPATKNAWPIMIGREGFPSMYVSDNSAPDFESQLSERLITENNLSNDDYLIIGGNDVKVDKDIIDSNIRSTIFDTPGVLEALNTHNVSSYILSGVGASKPKRDTVDTRIITDVQNLTGYLIDSPSDVGGYPQMRSGATPTDTDHDGMSDDWETAAGLNPKDPTDGAGDLDGDGYTNVEEYLFSLL